MTSDDDLYAELTKKFTKVAELQGQAGAHPIDILPSRASFLMKMDNCSI